MHVLTYAPNEINTEMVFQFFFALIRLGSQILGRVFIYASPKYNPNPNPNSNPFKKGLYI